MSLVYNPLRLMVAEYNRKHGTSHAFEEFEFSEPVDLRSFPASRPDGKNTMVIARIGNEEVTLFYSRMSVQTDMVKELAIGTPASNPIWRLMLTNECVGSKQTLWKALNRTYGLGLQGPEDIVDEPLVVQPNTVNQTVAVKFSLSNYIWLPGDVLTVTLRGKYVFLDGKPFFIDDCALHPAQWYEDWVFGSETGATMQPAQFLSFGVDYTPAKHLIRRIESDGIYRDWSRIGNSTYSDGFGTALAKWLSYCDGNPWVYTRAAAAWNIWYGWCGYNGPVEGAIKDNAMTSRVPAHLKRLLQAGNDRYTHVALIRLEQANNMKRSCLVLHYND